MGDTVDYQVTEAQVHCDLKLYLSSIVFLYVWIRYYTVVFVCKFSVHIGLREGTGKTYTDFHVGMGTGSLLPKQRCYEMYCGVRRLCHVILNQAECINPR